MQGDQGGLYLEQQVTYIIVCPRLFDNLYVVMFRVYLLPNHSATWWDNVYTIHTQ